MKIAQRMKNAMLLGCGLLSCACAPAPEIRNSRQIQAIEFNQHARAAYLGGDYQTSVEDYLKALQIDRSIENENGIAINLIGLSSAHQAIGQYPKAMQDLDQILQDKTLKFDSRYLSAAALKKSLLILHGNDVDGALDWAEKSEGYCNGCSMDGAILNLRAEIALRMNDPDTALDLAGKSRSNSKAEQANSARLMARARTLKRQYDLTLPLLEQALALDKSLGFPKRIRLDLVLLSDAYAKLGRQDLAKKYRIRSTHILSGTAYPDLKPEPIENAMGETK